jgi:predicted amidohydrolase
MSLRVSAIQLAFSYAATPQEFFDRVGAPIERAAQDGAQLVALPDYTGFLLLGVAMPVAHESMQPGDARGTMPPSRRCCTRRRRRSARVAGLRGADILLDFSAEEKGNDYHMAMRGVAARIQESHAYGVQAYAVTKLFGLNFCGPSNVVAPLGVWDDETIFMAQTKTHDREEAIAAKLDLAHLRQWRAAHPRDYNAALYRKYLPRSYEMYRVRAAQHGKRTIT